MAVKTPPSGRTSVCTKSSVSCVCTQHPPAISIWSCSVRWYLYRGRAHRHGGPAACMTSSMLVALALLHDVDKRRKLGSYGFNLIDSCAPET